MDLKKHLPKIILTLLLITIGVLIYFLLTKKNCDKISDDQILNWANSIIYIAGFKYDHSRNIYTTRQDALQRLGGYNALFDDLSTLVYMVIDIEPITFSYNNKDYMIELWKGQYYAATGCEIGVYLASKDLDGKVRPGRYYCAPDNEMLDMSYTLTDVSTNLPVFDQAGKHWWLTGFKPGVFNDPTNLALENIKITFPDVGMATAFYTALDKHFNDPAEYKYALAGNIVTFRWQKTKFPQYNLDARKDALDYNKQLTSYMKIIMNGDFSPKAVNDRVVQVIAFLETNDYIDDFLDWLIHGTKTAPDPKLQKVITDWDKANGNNDIQHIVDFLIWEKGRIDIEQSSIVKLLKVYCYFNPKSPLCIFIKS